jgi:hypothetical protein
MLWVLFVPYVFGVDWSYDVIFYIFTMIIIFILHEAKLLFSYLIMHVFINKSDHWSINVNDLIYHLILSNDIIPCFKLTNMCFVIYVRTQYPYIDV